MFKFKTWQRQKSQSLKGFFILILYTLQNLEGVKKSIEISRSRPKIRKKKL